MPGVSLREQLAEALGLVEALRAEIDELRADNDRLTDRVASLLADAKKDSSTSSKPPSRIR